MKSPGAPDHAGAAVSDLDRPGPARQWWAIPVGVAFRRAPTVLAAGVLLLLSIFFLGSVARFPYYSPVSNVEELTLMYTAAQNFVTYGFVPSMFLHDLSTSARAVDHPYVYNHMPPGPEIFIAVMLKAFGGSYRLVRLVFWAVFLAGMVCFFRFGDLILQRFGVAGAGYAILLISPYMLLHTFDDPLYASAPLLIFLPLLTLQAYYRTGRSRYLAATLVVGLVSSVYLDYLTLLMASWCWALLYFTQLLPLRRRHLIAFAAVIVSGLFLHLVQNFLYLGGELFFRELGMTISNRITGSPTKDELKAFYQAHGLVHHGASPLNLPGLLYHLWLGVSFPGLPSLLGAAAVTTAWAVARKAHWKAEPKPVVVVEANALPSLGPLVALWGWVVGTILLPMIMLPAFTQEYGIHGTGLHWYFLGIGVTASVLCAVRMIVDTMLPELERVRWQTFANALVALVLLGMLGNVVGQVVTTQVEQLQIAMRLYREAKYYTLDEISRRFSGEVFMTNINPVPVGFFARGAGHGVCELASLPAAGDIDPGRCHVSYMRRQDYYGTVRPRYFFFFQELFPGFAECLPSSLMPMQRRGGDDCVRQMEERLSARFEKTYENDLFQVFDLAAPRRE